MSRADSLFETLRGRVGQASVLTEPEDIIPYSFDGTAAVRCQPSCVVMVRNAAEVAAVLEIANERSVPVVTRGSGTGLSGGSVPTPGSIVLCTVRMNRILEIDPANLTILVEPGVTT